MEQPIDLYDMPIDLRPVPKPDIRAQVIEECITRLRENGDYFGVQLLSGWLESS